MRKWQRTAIELALPACVAAVIGWQIGWSPPQTAAFALAAASFAYAIRVLSGSDTEGLLHSPIVALPVIALFCLLIWHAQFRDPWGGRLISLLIVVGTFAPYAAAALFRILRLD